MTGLAWSARTKRVARMLRCVASPGIVRCGAMQRWGALSQCVASVVLVAAMLSPTVVSSVYARSVLGARVPVEYRAWTLRRDNGEKFEISQFAIPMIATFHLDPATQLVLSGSTGISSLSGGDVSMGDLNGMGDVKAQMYRRLGGRGLFLLGMNVPVGRRELTPEEIGITRLLGHPLLGMQMRQLGRGLDVNAGVAISVPLAPAWELGLGIGAMRSGSYVLLAGGEPVRPASELTGSLALRIGGVEDQPDDRVGLQLQATAHAYGDDRLEDRTIFEEGDQLDVGARAFLALGSLDCSLASTGVWKDDDVAYTRTSTGELIDALKHRPGAAVLTKGSVRYRFSNRLEAGVAGEWTRFRDSARGEENGDTRGFGPILSIEFGEGNWLSFQSLVLDGTADEQAPFDLSGISISANLVLLP